MDFKRYKIYTVKKKVSSLIYNLRKNFRFGDFIRYNFKKIYRAIKFNKFDSSKLIQYFSLKIYNFNFIRKNRTKGSNFIFFHLPLSIIFFGFLYLSIPALYNYDEKKIANTICKNKNIECLIKGKVGYRFYPTPRIKIKDIEVKEIDSKKNFIIKAEEVIVKLSFKNLLVKEKQKFKKIEIKNYEANLNLNNFKKYKDIVIKKNYILPANFKNGKITVYDIDGYVANISNGNINFTLENKLLKTKVKGKFLEETIYINLNSEKFKREQVTKISLKMPSLNFSIKSELLNKEKSKETTSGNFLIKKNDNKIAVIFTHKDNKINIIKSNLGNSFISGKLMGEIVLLPFFLFDLDIHLNNVNFKRLYNAFLSLEKNKKSTLFKINKKINGKLNLSSDKVYSGNNLVKSFESRLAFNNGNIIIDQFLINLGKLGAADLLGSIESDERFSNLKFQSNIFIDNKKKFLSKFGIYNKKKENISPNLFISGNINLKKLKASFYEISAKDKLESNDVNFIEQEFNDYMFSDGFKNLFSFSDFKNFLKSISSENK
jgi:hypothetical protein